MASVGNILNEDEFFADIVDTPKEGIEKHKKQEVLKNAVDKGKLGDKWTHERVYKAKNEFINKTYVECKQRDIENDPIIKDQMASLGCLLVCTFGTFLEPVLVAAHTANNFDLGDENEGYENEP